MEPQENQSKRSLKGSLVTRLKEPDVKRQKKQIAPPTLRSNVTAREEDLWNRSVLPQSDYSSLFPLHQQEDELYLGNICGITPTQIACLYVHKSKEGSWNSDKEYWQTKEQSEALNELRQNKV